MTSRPVERYPGLSMALHWIMAGLILATIPIGYVMGDMDPVFLELPGGEVAQLQTEPRGHRQTQPVVDRERLRKGRHDLVAAHHESGQHEQQEHDDEPAGDRHAAPRGRLAEGRGGFERRRPFGRAGSGLGLAVHEGEPGRAFDLGSRPGRRASRTRRRRAFRLGADEPAMPAGRAAHPPPLRAQKGGVDPKARRATRAGYDHRSARGWEKRGNLAVRLVPSGRSSRDLQYGESMATGSGMAVEGDRSGATVLELHGVGMRYGAADEVLRDVELTINAGSFHYLVGPSGAGKTSLLERTAEALQGRYTLAVIEGDIQTSYDAERLQRKGVQAVQINTDGACHLDGNMIRTALENLNLDAVDLLIIENVGNLVCPAEFNLGEHHKVTILSVAEGDDKPTKYPLMFQISSVLLVNKIDLLPYVDCDLEAIHRRAKQLNPSQDIFDISCRTGEGLEAWTAWLEARIREKKNRS